MASIPRKNPSRPNLKSPAWPLLLIALAVALVYAGNLYGPLVMDDLVILHKNPSILNLWPITAVLHPPADGSPVQGRPLFNLTIAINYAIGSDSVLGYHLVNIFLHLFNALLLYAIIRRTLQLPGIPPPLTKNALPIALVSALIWSVHPLASGAVDYISQRSELLFAFFYLLTFYCVLRAGISNRWWWQFAAVAACLLGMACKEVMVTAPVIVLLFDRIFLTKSFKESLRRRGWMYLGLAATWILLGFLVLATGSRKQTAGFGGKITPWISLLTQCKALGIYLKLTFWPHPLTFDYGDGIVITLKQVWPQAILILLLIAAILIGLRFKPRLAFLGICWFVILSPTSSFIPIWTQTIGEHRAYLPLAAIVVAVVCLIFLAAKRFFPIAAVTLILLLASLTFLRGRDYRTDVDLWRSVTKAYPSSLRGYTNLGIALIHAGQPQQAPQAIEQYQIANGYKQDYAEACDMLGSALLQAGLVPEAKVQFQAALAARPNYALAHSNLGSVLMLQGQVAHAINEYEQAQRLDPNAPTIHSQLGAAYLNASRYPEAIAQFQAALQLDPKSPDLHFDLGTALFSNGQTAEAIVYLQQAIQLNPADADIYGELASALVASGQTAAGIDEYQKAIAMNPDDPEEHFNLANTLVSAGQTPQAIDQFQEAIRLQPDLVAAQFNLANVLLRAGRFSEAVDHYQQAARLQPDSTDIHNNFAIALLNLQRIPEAVVQLKLAVQTKPDDLLALRTLAWQLATHPGIDGGDPLEAIKFASRACEITQRQDPLSLAALAAAYAANAQFDLAVSTGQEAFNVAQAAGQTTMAQQIQSQLQFYRAGTPYIEAAPPAANPQ